VAVSWLTAAFGVGTYIDARLRVFTDAGEAAPEVALAEAPPGATMDLKDVHREGDGLWFLVQRSWAYRGQPPQTVFASFVPLASGGAAPSEEEAIREGGDSWAYDAAKLYPGSGGLECFLLTSGRAGGDGLVVYSRSGPGTWRRRQALQPTIDPSDPAVPEMPSHAAVRKPWWGGEPDGPSDLLYSGLVPRRHPTRGLSPVYNVWFLRGLRQPLKENSSHVSEGG